MISLAGRVAIFKHNWKTAPWRYFCSKATSIAINDLLEWIEKLTADISKEKTLSTEWTKIAQDRLMGLIKEGNRSNQLESEFLKFESEMVRYKGYADTLQKECDGQRKEIDHLRSQVGDLSHKLASAAYAVPAPMPMFDSGLKMQELEKQNAWLTSKLEDKNNAFVKERAEVASIQKQLKDLGVHLASQRTETALQNRKVARYETELRRMATIAINPLHNRNQVAQDYRNMARDALNREGLYIDNPPSAKPYAGGVAEVSIDLSKYNSEDGVTLGNAVANSRGTVFQGLDLAKPGVKDVTAWGISYLDWIDPFATSVYLKDESKRTGKEVADKIDAEAAKFWNDQCKELIRSKKMHFDLYSTNPGDNTAPKQEVYKSSTHGNIPLSFRGRHLLQSLREAVNQAIKDQNFTTQDMRLSRVRGEIATYMSQLELDKQSLKNVVFAVEEEAKKKYFSISVGNGIDRILRLVSGVGNSK